MGIVFSWPEGIQTFLATVYHGSDCLFGRGREAKLIVPLSKDEKALQRTLSGSISFNKRSFDRNASGSRSFKDRTLKRNGSGSITYRGRKLERNFSGSNSSKGRILERNVSGSRSFKGRFQEGTPSGMNSIRRLDSPIEKSDCWTDKPVGASLNSGSFKEEAAAVKLQKVYKSYRTRRNLADCAVLVEELWWQAIDFVTLKRSTVSFFDISRHESASSRWARARIKAAKVGKGLSKDDKARKLAFQHWLEAIDPRHRYGHNLHFYYDAWFESDTAEPFFYWLDVGEGRDLNLDRCPRIRVQYQCIKYLGPKEREQYEVAIQDGRLLYKQTNKPVNTSLGSKWIFVLSTSKKLYVGQKRKGTFQHSSFLAGGATSAAGRLVAAEGILKSIWPYSGHYLPTEENFKEFISFLEENNVDLSNVQKTPADEDDNSVQNGKMSVIGSEPVSEAEKEDQSSISKFKDVNIDKECIESNPICNETESATAMLQIEDAGKMTARQEVFADRLEAYITDVNESGSAQCPENGIQSTEEQGNVEVLCYKRSLSDKNLDNSKLEVPQQSLLQRLESKKSLQSYQLGKKVSFKWSTGAGPRIICVRDYPSELRVKALEKVNLSPRCGLSSSSPRQLVSPKCAL